MYTHIITINNISKLFKSVQNAKHVKIIETYWDPNFSEQNNKTIQKYRVVRDGKRT